MQTGFVERDGYRLHYAMSGRNHAPPLLLLHPLGAALEVWAPVLPMLEPHFRVIRYDVRGHGKSELDAGPPSPRAMDDMAADALAVLDAVRAPRAHWCAFTSVVWAASAILERRPRDIVAKLFWVSEGLLRREGP